LCAAPGDWSIFRRENPFFEKTMTENMDLSPSPFRQIGPVPFAVLLECLNIESIGSAGDFNKMIAELGLDWTVNFANFTGEHDFIEFGHHLALAEFAQAPSFFSRRTLRVFFGELGKIGAGVDLGLEFFAGLFCGDENVSGRSFLGHAFFLSIKLKNEPRRHTVVCNLERTIISQPPAASKSIDEKAGYIVV
jgi:hypothetical protein